MTHCATCGCARAATPAAPEALPRRKDVAEAFCFLRRHEHTATTPSCPASRQDADALVRALAARYDSRAAFAGDRPWPAAVRTVKPAPADIVAK